MNWKKVIEDLERSGLTQCAIGEAAGCSQGQISDLKKGRRGKRLDFNIGQNLLELRKKRCNDKTTAA